MIRKSKYTLRMVAGFATSAILLALDGKVTGIAETIRELAGAAAILFTIWSLLELDKLEQEEFRRLRNAPFKRERGIYGQ